MTTAELIAELEKMPANAEAYCPGKKGPKRLESVGTNHCSVFLGFSLPLVDQGHGALAWRNLNRQSHMLTRR